METLGSREIDSGKMLMYPKIIPSHTSVLPNATLLKSDKLFLSSRFLKNQASQHLCIKETDQY